MSATTHGAPAPQADASRQDLLTLLTGAGAAQATHRACIDTGLLPCHHRQYDTAGRMRRGPPPLNPPPHAFESDSKTRLG